ncbi:MAG: ABC transporter substrate-binding protein [Promethearchaeota archaeon]
MVSGERKIMASTQCIFLLVLLMSQISLHIVFAEINQQDENRNKSIVWETSQLPYYLDPHKDYSSVGSHVSFNVYETLYMYPFDTADTTPLEPLLAESLMVSSDGLTYTITLRQGITFHDGTPFNATCVQMNFERMLGTFAPGGPVWMVAEHILGGQAIEDAVARPYNVTLHEELWNAWVAANAAGTGAVNVIDDYTVEIKLAFPYTPFLAIISNPGCSMISPTFFLIHGGMSPADENVYLNNHTCGTGPYMLDDWIQDDRLSVVLNPNYWREEEAWMTNPYAGFITEVTWKKNDDAISMMENLKEGTTDSCSWLPSNAYDIWNNVTTRGEGTEQSLNQDIKVWTGLPRYSIKFLGFNMSDCLNYDGEIVQNPFQYWNLRKAISYAFDYDVFIDTIMNGIATGLQGPIPKGLFGHDENLFMFTKDLNAAVTHWNLAMAEGLDDIWANNSYELNIYFHEFSDTEEVSCFLVKQALEEIIANPASNNSSLPLTINVRPIDYFIDLYGEEPPLIISALGWIPDYADPDVFVVPLIRSENVYPNMIGLVNSTGENSEVWDVEAVDGWIDAAAQEDDPAERMALYAQIQEAIVDHCAYIWCCQYIEFHVERHELNGYVFNPMRKPYFFHYYKLGAPTHQVIPIEVFIASGIVIGVIAIVILKKSSKD